MKEIIREWQLRPPQRLSTPPEDLSVLASLPNATLQNLETSADRLEEFVSALPHWRSWNNAVQEKIAEIEKIARENLSKESDLSDLRQQVADKVTAAQAAKAGCDEKAKELARLSQAYEPEKIREALHDAAHESDVVAENIAERFLAGDIDVDQFLLDYVEIRKVGGFVRFLGLFFMLVSFQVGQIRKTKEEKLNKQLRELHRAGF